MTPAKNIFLSHVEDDQEIALPLAAELSAMGHSVWCYENDSLPGQSYLLNTQHAIEQCPVFLLLISQNSLASRQVNVEVERAHEQSRRIIPVLLNISDREYKRRNPLWAQVVGTATSVAISRETLPSVARRIVQGLAALGVMPETPSTPLVADVPAITLPPTITPRRTIVSVSAEAAPPRVENRSTAPQNTAATEPRTETPKADLNVTPGTSELIRKKGALVRIICGLQFVGLVLGLVTLYVRDEFQNISFADAIHLTRGLAAAMAPFFTIAATFIAVSHPVWRRGAIVLNGVLGVLGVMSLTAAIFIMFDNSKDSSLWPLAAGLILGSSIVNSVLLGQIRGLESRAEKHHS